MSVQGWIGVDLDGTLAHYEGWNGGRIGMPVPAMVDRVKRMLDRGVDVRIFTARAYRWQMLQIAYDAGLRQYSITDNSQVEILSERVRMAYEDDLRHVSDWVIRHIGAELPITCIKDYSMIELYDDRAKQVEPNTGRTLESLLCEGVPDYSKEHSDDNQ